MRVGFWVAGFAPALVWMSTALAQVNDQTRSEVAAMKWLPAVNVALKSSHSQITSVPGYAAITGMNSIRYEEIAGNETLGVEADLVNPKTYAEAVFSYEQTGFVRSDDWSSVDKDRFLDEVSRNTEAANANRRLRGISPLHVDGWITPPTLNAETHTAYWIISNHDEAGERSLNAVALKLGRYGAERIIFIDNANNAGLATQNLLLIATAHQFETGSRYQDYVVGTDKAAEYGVAGLVAGAMGIKLVQATAVGGIALLLKKCGFIIAFPLFWVWRELFRREKVSNKSRNTAPR